MAYQHLLHFSEHLRLNGELVDISFPASTDLEITEITDRVVKAGGSALMFLHPDGGNVPLLINAYGSEKRMALALGVSSLSDIAERIEALIRLAPPRTWRERLALLPTLKELSSCAPRRVRNGRCKEVVEINQPSVSEIPILRCWPEDGGRYITLGQVYTRHPTSGRVNVGLYRIQVFDERTLGMHWQIHKGGAAHYREHLKADHRMEAAIVLGGDPALAYCASAPLPEEIEELVFAGFLRREPVDLAPCETIDLDVPADAEFVLEGYIIPGEERLEGPFGDHTGYYSLADPYPVFHLTAVTRARDPIYPTIIVGKPPMEDAFLGKATERIFLPLIRMTLPEVVDINLPVETLFHSLALVSIRKQYPGHAYKAAHALWGLGQMAFCKTIIVFDEEVDVKNVQDVLWRFANNVAPQRDVGFVRGPVDVLDNSSEYPRYGSKMVIDATKTWPEEGFDREWPPDVAMSVEVKERVDRIWSELNIPIQTKESIGPL
ncbi:MAG: menaquinone biosynthesis decarboxylase [bacterium]